MTVNVTAPLTKDTLSAAQRASVISRWGGLMSEGACFVYDRSVYQMKGPDGYLDHLAALLAGNARYYYAPQEIGASPEITPVGISSSAANGNAVKLITSGDAGVFPTLDESNAELGGTPHNHSGSMIGIYGHSVASVNGVYRVRSRQAGNGVTIECAYSANGSGGSLVHSNSATPVKALSISPITDGILVTTELPHNIPDAADEITRVRIFGYTGVPNDLTYPVKKTSETAFELSFLEIPLATRPMPLAQTTVGICFYTRADLWHWLGLSYMLWQSGKALEYSSGSVALTVNTKRAYLPSGMSPDGAYTALTSITGKTGALTATPKKSFNTATFFTDAVLNEPLLFTSGPNAGKFRRVLSYTGSVITVDVDFDNADTTDNFFEIGRINTSSPLKILQLTRTFNGGTRKVEVFPAEVRGQVHRVLAAQEG